MEERKMEEQVLPNEDDAGLFDFSLERESKIEETTSTENIFLVNESMESMIRAYVILEKIPESERDTEYRQIMAYIQSYLNQHCCHEFVDDYIDLTPDYGCSITYCQKCGLS